MATKEMQKETPPLGYRLAGWLYIDDDANGPFFCEEKHFATRYLNHWPLFEREPFDKHTCNRVWAYGECDLCKKLDKAT